MNEQYESNVRNSQLPYTRNANRLQKTSQNSKIDAQSFIEEYRALKQQQKDFLSQINLSSDLKKVIFGFDDKKDLTKPPCVKEKLVALIDPFKGRLIINEKDWLEIQQVKEKERLNLQNELKNKEIEQQNKRLRRMRKQRQMRQNEQKIKQENEKKEKPEEQHEKKSSSNFLSSLLKKFSRDSVEEKAQQKDKDKPASPKKMNKILTQIEQQPEINNARIEKTETQNSQKSKSKLKSNPSKNKDYNETNAKIVDQKTKSKGGKPLNFLQQIIKDAAQINKKEGQSYNEENIRMQSKAKFNPNPPNDDDIYEIISQIPKTGGKDDYSSPSVDGNKNFDNESLEDMLRSKGRMR